MITSTHYRFRQYDDLQTPIRLHETTALSRLLKNAGAVLSIAAVLMASPAVVYAAFVVGEADFAALGTSISPTPMLVTFAALVAICIAWRLIMPRLPSHFGRNRIVTINADQVTVRERSWFRWREWREPLAHYCGLESINLATPAGRRQKLMLTHSQPSREIALWVGDQVPSGLEKGYERLLCRAVRQAEHGFERK